MPSTVTNPLGQTTTYGYDCGSGAITSIQSPNDAAASPVRAGTVYTYEPLAGRMSTISYPDNGLTTVTYPSYTETDTTVTTTPDPAIVSASIFDIYGRPYRSVTGGNVSETDYDNNGRANCVTNPFATGGTSTGSTCIMSYDGFDRPLTQLQADGQSSRTWSYDENTVHAFDEMSHETSRTSNAFGHLTSVTEANGAQTSYAYDGLGNINTITQAGVAASGDIPRVRTFTYDSMSRLTCESHVESAQNPCPLSAASPLPSGITRYSYYPAGNISTRTDASNVTATYTYDTLNRLTFKRYSDGTVLQGFSYDGTSGNGSAVPAPYTTNSIGQLTHTSNYRNVASFYGYDAMGRLTAKSDCLVTDCSYSDPQSATYDLAGNMTSLKYPSGRTVQQTYDGAGRLASVTQIAGPGGVATTQPVVSSIGYFPDGTPQQTVYGNGASETITKNSRLQPCQIQASMTLGGQTAVSLMNRQYYYDNPASPLCQPANGNNGNIWAIVDGLNAGASQGFGYDGLNRLNSASRNDGLYTQSYSIDSFGNMLPTNVGTGTHPSYSITASNQLQLSGNVYTYSKSGNLTYTGPYGHSYQYDAESHIVNVDAGSTASYAYDATGDRVYKSALGSWRDYVYFNGQAIAGWTTRACGRITSTRTERRCPVGTRGFIRAACSRRAVTSCGGTCHSRRMLWVAATIRSIHVGQGPYALRACMRPIMEDAECEV